MLLYEQAKGFFTRLSIFRLQHLETPLFSHIPPLQKQGVDSNLFTEWKYISLCLQRALLFQAIECFC